MVVAVDGFADGQFCRLVLLVRAFPLHQRCTQRQFVGRQPHRFACILVRHAFHFKQNLARLHDRDPMIGSALAFAHTGFSRLLGDRLIRKHADPDLAAALDEARHGDTAGLDLPVGDPSRLEHLQPIVAERQRRSAPCFAGHAAALLLAILHFLWHQHNEVLSSRFSVKLQFTNAIWPSAFRIPQNPPTAACGSRFFCCRISPLYTQHFTPITPYVVRASLNPKSMSARSVCSGNRPCRYHSERAISLPFSRPLTRTLIPLQPKRSAESTALRMARRKPTRFSSCSAIDSETSCASSSGLCTSWMSTNTSREVRFCSSALSLSISAPLRPMMMPGRAVLMMMRSLLPGRSISMALTPADLSLSFSSFFSLTSSWSSLS